MNEENISRESLLVDDEKGSGKLTENEQHILKESKLLTATISNRSQRRRLRLLCDLGSETRKLISNILPSNVPPLQNPHGLQWDPKPLKAKCFKQDACMYWSTPAWDEIGSFHFIEAAPPPTGRYGGRIRFTAGYPSSWNTPQAIMNSKRPAIANLPWLGVEVKINSTSNELVKQFELLPSEVGLTFGWNDLVESPGTSMLEYISTSVDITVLLAPGMPLRHIVVSTTNLDVEFDGSIAEGLKHGNGVGDIADEEPWLGLGNLSNPRHIVIRTTSGSIKGTYPLYDHLDVSSNSGSIDVDVKPQAVDPKRPNFANFRAETQSGSVRFSFPEDAFSIPVRWYVTDVSTKSGSIHADYIMGNSSKLETQDGSITVRIRPLYLNTQTRSMLTTTTRSGRVTFELDDAIHENGPLQGLYLWHRTSSGSVQGTYGRYWSGRIKAVSSSGGIHLDGRHVVIERDSRVGGHHVVKARRGDEESNEVDISTQSGSISALFE